jgi:hypothetical protein
MSGPDTFSHPDSSSRSFLNTFPDPGLKSLRNKNHNYGVQDFLTFITHIRVIRQIHNIHIPLFFHWKTCYKKPDWNIRWFLNDFANLVFVFFLQNAGVEIPEHPLKPVSPISKKKIFI